LGLKTIGCVVLRDTFEMTTHLNKDRIHTTENVGHKLFTKNVFSSPDLFDILLTKTRNCFGSVKPNIKKEFLGILESK
jgi:hypothetical protein